MFQHSVLIGAVAVILKMAAGADTPMLAGPAYNDLPKKTMAAFLEEPQIGITLLLCPIQWWSPPTVLTITAVRRSTNRLGIDWHAT